MQTRVFNIAVILFSSLYGYILASLPAMAFKDRASYLNYAAHSDVILAERASHGILSALINEPVWLLVNIAFEGFFTPEHVVWLLIFLGASTFAYHLLRTSPRNFVWLVVFLLTPQVLKNYTTHLRQGMAMAIFFAGFFAGGGLRSWALMATAPFVHASFFILLPIAFFPKLLRKLSLAIDVRLLAYLALAAGIVIGLEPIASVLGARQAERYSFEMAGVTGLGFIFWISITGLFLLQGKPFLRKHEAAVGILLFYLVSYFLIDVTARVFESGMPLVMLAGLALADWRRLAFLGAVVSYSILQWIFVLWTI